MGLEIYGFTSEILKSLSYESKLQKSLRKTTLRKIDKQELLTEVQNVIDFYMGCEIFDKLDSDNLDYRIKSIDSCVRKFEKYYPNTEINKTFNDILGFRIIENYDNILKEDLSSFRIVDMRTGKAVDDGYRGIHLYYIESNFHYPIEIQINSEDDRRFADWTHMMTYKYVDNPAISAYLRKKYDEGLIKNALEFKEALDDVLSGGKEF